ncbi:MAG: hypothetical protein EOO38_23935 [Cytophagaceae bacterium]|nr:MAG: hypothetical protein EOO38_23935 [Cytophagaceae bacterium]
MVALTVIVYRREDELVADKMVGTSQNCFIVCIEVKTGGSERSKATATALSPVQYSLSGRYAMNDDGDVVRYSMSTTTLLFSLKQAPPGSGTYRQHPRYRRHKRSVRNIRGVQ